MDNEVPSHQAVLDATAETEAHMPPQRVPINVYETSAAMVIVAPLPAVTADDVTVEVRPGRLRFYAELRSAGPREYLVHEWEYGGFEREVDLPPEYGAGVECTLSNGQLAIRVLKGRVTEELTSVKPNAS